MRKPYAKPVIEIETYHLSASIAANCSSVINLGPGIPGVQTGEFRQCGDFEDSGFLSFIPGMSIQSDNHQPFYSTGEAGCDCYYTSGGHGYFTS